MLKLPSLYEQSPATWDTLAVAGYRGAAEMAKHFEKCSVMDRALGFENSVAAWHRGAAKPSGTAEARCNQWLDANVRNISAAPVINVTQGTLLLVACDSAAADKAKRLLSILGCEVTEV